MLGSEYHSCTIQGAEEKLAVRPPMIWGTTVREGAVEVVADGVGEGAADADGEAVEELGAAAFGAVDAFLAGPATTVVRRLPFSAPCILARNWAWVGT
ncbi:hypothetical protein [Streptomyces tropicalis]|uniref:Uncharacterized protein n=1 Tax=Streptomyces tropicalis TaxID=3034234 RepID=A0ABT6A7U4_9ACTN|nr:hypothetical protein [Streptomyces tropicalis]MDF3300720.1 hypothetical protein [Streptomyces tropicalis]